MSFLVGVSGKREHLNFVLKLSLVLKPQDVGELVGEGQEGLFRGKRQPLEERTWLFS